MGAAAQAATLEELAAQPQGKVVLLRHALAPGFGDPSNFRIGDCSTQRNLDAVGRQQSRNLGQRFRDAGVRFVAVFSSQWCRCSETARLMEVGPVQEFSGLNSFFQGYADRTETLRRLRQKLGELPPDQGPYLMVTHQVVVSAITGRSVSSGGAMVYDLASGSASYLDL
jgi:broad specificity phosphatase PhoE